MQAAPPDWDDLRVLLAVIRTGSFLAAARELKLAVSTVSRRVGQLERRLGIIVVERRADGAYVTPAGRSLAAIAEKMELELSATMRAGDASRQALTGVIRLSVGDGFTRLLMDCVAKFTRQHPQVNFEFVVEARAVDLRKREADLAIRTTHKQEQSLVYRRLGELHYALWAASDYIDRAGKPQNRQDLTSHSFVTFGPPLDRHHTVAWLRELGAVRFSIRTTSFRSLLAAIGAGMGIGALPRRAARGLVELLPGTSPHSLPLYLVAHPQALRRAEVRAFADAIVADLSGMLDEA